LVQFAFGHARAGHGPPPARSRRGGDFGGLLPVAAAPSMVALSALAAVAGVAVAAAITTLYTLIDDVAPRGTATEATSWFITAYGGGFAWARRSAEPSWI
jgi:hypothetical protein